MNVNAGKSFVNAAAVTAGSMVFSGTPGGLMHDAGLAIEWSVKEQYKLEEGLAT